MYQQVSRLLVFTVIAAVLCGSPAKANQPSAESAQAPDRKSGAVPTTALGSSSPERRKEALITAKPKTPEEVFAYLLQAEERQNENGVANKSGKNPTFRAASAARRYRSSKDKAEQLLVEMGPSIAPDLVKHLNDPNQDCVHISRSALASFGGASVTPLLAAYKQRRITSETLALALQGVGPVALPSLFTLLASSSDQTSKIEFLSAIGAAYAKPLEKTLPLGPKDLKTLINYTGDRDAQTRFAAVRTLAVVTPNDPIVTTKILKEFASTSDISSQGALVSTLAATTVGQSAENAGHVADALGKILAKDKSSYVRETTAGALAEIHNAPKAAIRNLLIGLHDKDISVRSAVLNAMANFKDAAAIAIPEISNAFADPKQATTLPALRTITAMGAAGGPAVPALVKLSQSTTEVGIYSQLALAFKAIGPAASPAVPELIKMLKCGSLGVQFSAMDALGHLGPAAKSAEQPLRDLAASDEKMRPVAQYVLKRIAKQQALTGSK